MLSVVMLSDVLLSVVMLDVVMLSATAPISSVLNQAKQTVGLKDIREICAAI